MANLQETWLPILDYPNYEISSLGNIRQAFTKKPLKQRPNTRGYLIVGLRKEGVQKTFLVHRLVAIHFIENPDNKAEVNHRWGDKKDNRATELEWTTRKENEQHARRVLGKKSLFSNNASAVTGINSPRAKAVIKLLNGEVLKVYDLIAQVKDDGFNPAMVSHCCNKRRKTHKGFNWEYKN